MPKDTVSQNQVQQIETSDAFTDFRAPNEASFDKLVKAIDRAYHRPFVMMGRSFLQGLMTSLGATAGFAIVMVILFYVLQSLGGIDYFAPGIHKLQDLIIPASVRTQLDQANSLQDTLQRSQAQLGRQITPPLVIPPSPTLPPAVIRH